MFVLLKTLLFFFRPLIWVLILFFIGVFTKKQKLKWWCFRLSMLLLLFFSNPFIIKKCIELYEVKPVELARLPKYNTGVLLGGMVSYNRYDDQGYFNPASDRFIQTALLFKTGHINTIIVAAGNGYITKNNFREALFLREKLIDLGIPADRIFTDTSSRNTLENAFFSKKLIDSHQLEEPYLLISSAMHLPRASLVFRKAGINADLYPCDFVSKRVGNNFIEDYILPSSSALMYWDNFIKEMVGTITYKLTGKG